MKAFWPARSDPNPTEPDGRHDARDGRFLYTLALLWLVGASLRVTVLAIPPLLPQVQHDLGLSQTGVGVLSSLPSLLFAAAAIPGAALVSRYGALPTLLAGLLLTGVGSALRGLSPDTLMLLTTTVAMSAGIAVMQPALPRIVRDWLPHHVGLATAVYSNGMLGSEALSASLTIPFILPLVGGSWRLSLVFWSLPIFAVALLLAAARRRRSVAIESAAPVTGSVHHWWPDWRSPLTWELGLVMGCASGIYFGVNAFLPGYLTKSGHADLVDDALAAINVVQIPATVLLFFFAQRLCVRRTPYVVMGALATVGVLGLIVMPGTWAVLWSAVIGLCCASVITLCLTLPPLLSKPDEVQRLAGAAFTIGYAWAVVIPILGGFAWDVSTLPVTTFLPAAACGVLIAVVGARFRSHASDDSGWMSHR